MNLLSNSVYMCIFCFTVPTNSIPFCDNNRDFKRIEVIDQQIL